jgi:hypothetical protein
LAHVQRVALVDDRLYERLEAPVGGGQMLGLQLGGNLRPESMPSAARVARCGFGLVQPFI